MGTAVTLIKKKVKIAPTTQKGMFQLVSKKWIGPNAMSPSKTSANVECEDDSAKPSPFRFINP
jgi:hypothetical protein